MAGTNSSSGKNSRKLGLFMAEDPTGSYWEHLRNPSSCLDLNNAVHKDSDDSNSGAFDMCLPTTTMTLGAVGECGAR